MTENPEIGSIAWRDLTVPNAAEVRDFYQAVVGWDTLAEDMGEYEDYHMLQPGSDQSVAGVCHARGSNADLPPQWLVYVHVEDVEASARRCLEKGGEVVAGPRPMGAGQLCVVRDPAGAVLGLWQAR